METSRLNVDAEEFIPSNEVQTKDNYQRNAVSLTGTMENDLRKNISLNEQDFSCQKETVNIVFCGHVDAGKSTIAGQLMYLTGRVDQRTIEKYRQEAREKSRESWYLSWIFDTNNDERDRGKTVEVGRGWFETERKHWILLDTPGHQHFVPNMIEGVSQADLAVLVISARKNEFETGFEGGGQTSEHVLLVRSAGIQNLIILINKMDDPTVQWNKNRFDEIQEKLDRFLRKVGFKSENVFFMPCSGLNGTLLKYHSDEERLSWYKGPTFLNYLDNLPSFIRNFDGPFRMTVIEQIKDSGHFLMGRILSGSCHINDRCILMPKRILMEILNIYLDDQEKTMAVAGENIRLKLKDIDENDISIGSILCRIEQNLCSFGRLFEVQILVLDVKNLITVGYSSMFHIHSMAMEIKIRKFIHFINRKTGEKLVDRRQHILKDDIAIVHLELIDPTKMICIERYEDFPQLGRFTLRDHHRTIAIGKILKILE